MAGSISGGAPGTVANPRGEKRFWGCGETAGFLLQRAAAFSIQGRETDEAGGKGRARELLDETELERNSDEETKGARVEKADSTLPFGRMNEL